MICFLRHQRDRRMSPMRRSRFDREKQVASPPISERLNIGLLSVLTLPFESAHTTTETSPGNKTNNNDTIPTATIRVRHVYPGWSTFMTDHREDDTTERLLEPSDIPISEGTIRAVVVVGLITFFVATFLYWQSWRERHKRPPCVTKLRLRISNIVRARCGRARATGTRWNGDSSRETICDRDQRSHINRLIPGRIKIIKPSAVPSPPHSTTSSPSTASSIYHSPASSEMVFIYETVSPTRENVGETLTAEQSPGSTMAMPSEQILHV